MDFFYKTQLIERQKYGYQKEDELYEIIKNKFDNELVKTKNKYNKFDYESDKTMVELKSRRIKYGSFPSIFINKHKCDEADNKYEDKDVYFVFSFLNNQNYFIKYDKKLFENFKITDVKSPQFKGFRRCYEFPISLLIKI
jgi:hypothetical protein